MAPSIVLVFSSVATEIFIFILSCSASRLGYVILEALHRLSIAAYRNSRVWRWMVWVCGFRSRTARHRYPAIWLDKATSHYVTWTPITRPYICREPRGSACFQLLALTIFRTLPALQSATQDPGSYMKALCARKRGASPVSLLQSLLSPTPDSSLHQGLHIASDLGFAHLMHPRENLTVKNRIWKIYWCNFQRRMFSCNATVGWRDLTFFASLASGLGSGTHRVGHQNLFATFTHIHKAHMVR